MTTVLCVLRSGGDFDIQHVHALRCGVQSHWFKPLHFVCLTDQKLGLHGVAEVPLVGGWPGWWSKMEAFRPDIEGDVLLMDLDTVIVGDLSDIANRGDLTIMRDVYRPKGLQSSLVYIPEAEKAAVWDAWLKEPEEHMYRHRSDQDFLETLWLDRAERWQDVLPGQVVSWKADCRYGVPEGARVVIYHGQPRPWETELWAA